MKNNRLTLSFLELGLLYFYIHFVCEVACFFILSNMISRPVSLWMVALFYDTFAFVPQSIFGYISDKYPKIKMGLIGLILLILAIFIFSLNIQSYIYLTLFILCVGNCLIHINGAEITLKNSNGKMSLSAIFVSGGSFGVIIGKIFSSLNVSYYAIIILLLSAIPFVIYGDTFKGNKCINYNYANIKVNSMFVVLLAASVVIFRGYMGYGIPTSWKKTLFENVLFYFSMGLGKALGGILIDTIGIRKTSFISLICSIPFLIFGDNNIYLSLIGILFFSMTMAITLAILVSVLPNKPGLAFGITTIGLFLGAFLAFFINIKEFYIQSIFVIIISIICLLLLNKITRKDIYDI